MYNVISYQAMAARELLNGYKHSYFSNGVQYDTSNNVQAERNPRHNTQVAYGIQLQIIIKLL